MVCLLVVYLTLWSFVNCQFNQEINRDFFGAVPLTPTLPKSEAIIANLDLPKETDFVKNSEFSDNEFNGNNNFLQSFRNARNQQPTNINNLQTTNQLQAVTSENKQEFSNLFKPKLTQKQNNLSIESQFFPQLLNVQLFPRTLEDSFNSQNVFSSFGNTSPLQISSSNSFDPSNLAPFSSSAMSNFNPSSQNIQELTLSANPIPSALFLLPNFQSLTSATLPFVMNSQNTNNLIPANVPSHNQFTNQQIARLNSERNKNHNSKKNTGTDLNKFSGIQSLDRQNVNIQQNGNINFTSNTSQFNNINNKPIIKETNAVFGAPPVATEKPFKSSNNSDKNSFSFSFSSSLPSHTNLQPSPLTNVNTVVASDNSFNSFTTVDDRFAITTQNNFNIPSSSFNSNLPSSSISSNDVHSHGFNFITVPSILNANSFNSNTFNSNIQQSSSFNSPSLTNINSNIPFSSSNSNGIASSNFNKPSNSLTFSIPSSSSNNFNSNIPLSNFGSNIPTSGTNTFNSNILLSSLSSNIPLSNSNTFNTHVSSSSLDSGIPSTNTFNSNIPSFGLGISSSSTNSFNSNIPSFSLSSGIPSSSTNTFNSNIPSNSLSSDIPSSNIDTFNSNMHSSSANTNIPFSSTNTNIPFSSTNTNIPSFSTNTNIPSSSTNTFNSNTPSSSLSLNIPSSNFASGILSSSTNNFNSNIPSSSSFSFIKDTNIAFGAPPAHDPLPFKSTAFADSDQSNNINFRPTKVVDFLNALESTKKKRSSQRESKTFRNSLLQLTEDFEDTNSNSDGKPSSYDAPVVPWNYLIQSTSYGDPIIG